MTSPDRIPPSRFRVPSHDADITITYSRGVDAAATVVEEIENAGATASVKPGEGGTTEFV